MHFTGCLQIDETGAINDELTTKFENNNLYIKLRGDILRMINNLKINY